MGWSPYQTMPHAWGQGALGGASRADDCAGSLKEHSWLGAGQSWDPSKELEARTPHTILLPRGRGLQVRMGAAHRPGTPGGAG